MNKLTLSFGIAAVVLAGSTWAFWKQLGDQRARNEILQAQIVQTRECAVAEVATAPSVQGAVTVASTPETRRTDPPSAADTPECTDTAAIWRKEMKSQAALYEDPEYRQARREQRMRDLRQNTYSDLAEALRLSSDEEDRFLGLLADQDLRSMANSPAYAPGAQPSEEELAEIQRRYEEQRRQNSKEIETFLGREKFLAFKEYEDNMGARIEIRALRASLERSPDAIREDQVPVLISAMGAVDAQIQRERKAARTARVDTKPLTAADEMRVLEDLIKTQERHMKMRLEAAAPYLSGRQLDRLDRKLDADIETLRAQLRLQRAQRQAQGPTTEK